MQIPNRGPQVEATVILFIVLTWLTVLVRCYVRIWMIKCFAIDDWLILVTLFFFTIFGGLVLNAVHWGLGKHNADLTIPQQTVAFEMWFFGELFYILTTTMLRLAVGHFLLRVALRKKHRYTIHVLNAINIIFNIFFFLFAIFTCSPVQYFWTRVNQEHNGTCMNLASAYVTFAQSAISVVMDWTYGILPMFIVWDLNMSRRKKVLVGMILSLGALASTASIVRLPYLYQIAHDDDFLWYAGPVGLWSFVEPGMGITAVSLATLRPLFHSFLVHIGLSTSNDTARRYKFSANNSRPRMPPHSSSVGGSSSLKKAYIRSDGDLFEDDEDLQLRGIAPTMGNECRIESGIQRAPSRRALNGDWSPLEGRGEKNGAGTTWLKGDSENDSTRISEDEIAVTKTMHVSTWSADNGPTKVFLV